MGRVALISPRLDARLVLEALQRCNSEQRLIILEHYGRIDEVSVENVKVVFFSLQLDAAFLNEYQRKTLASIDADISSVDESDRLRRRVFLYYMDILVIA